MKMIDKSSGASIAPALTPVEIANEAYAYWLDAAQRSLLFLDVMRLREARYQQQAAKIAPNVLSFECELVMDGRKLSRPVNYVLVRVTPPTGTIIDDRKRPFVVVDPRAGHGPGIGGFKPQSEIGVAFKAGHPCYFIGFLPEPMPGQTIEDVARAEGVFLDKVIELHPDAEGKPAVIGNCQAGWAVMMLAAMRPELFGPIIVAGAPLSYWAGVHGENPMRYTGGALGGSWLTALTGDLGNGKFDGAWLVSNFENLNPSNTLWSKQYNLYANIDSEAPRYLEFEKWWGGHVVLNADEMQYIADQLFIGNKLASGGIAMSDGAVIDLRNIRSPIIVFCSRGDNITPPPQALDWILDLYESVDEIRTYGQTIVYAVHDTIGHLGIFVSGSVAKKEHDEFASNIDLIDVLPPGLYEAVITPKTGHEGGADLIAGDYLVRFEARTLDDIRALGGNDEADDLKFAAAARLSEINLGFYRTFVQPWVRMWTNEGAAEWMRRMHPLRLQYEMFAGGNPMMRTMLSSIEAVREHRQPVPKHNVFWQAQEAFSDWMRTSLDAYRDSRDRAIEAWFHATYGSPLLQASVGLKGSEGLRKRPGMSAAHKALVQQRIEELKANISEGGPREAIIRALLYIRMPDGVADERGFNLLRKLRGDAGRGMSLADFKRTVREQYFALLLDERSAVDTIPDLLAREPKLAGRMVEIMRELIETVTVKSKASKARLAEVEAMLDEELGGAVGERSGVQIAKGARGAHDKSHAERSSKH